MFKIGLIGCGGMGSFHAKCYEALKDSAKVVAIADLDLSKAEAANTNHNATIYASAEELLNNAEVDIVDICLPTFLHKEYAVKAMEKGCHVFLEKPVCLNLEQAKELLDAEKRTGKKIQIGQVVRFMDEYVWLKNIVDTNKYGKLLSGVFYRLSQKVVWGWENWFQNPNLSGAVALDLHIHDVDYVRYLLGDPDEVCSTKATRNAEGALQQMFTTYRYGDAIVSLEACWDYPDCFPFQSGFRVKFEKATVVLHNGDFTVYPEDGEPFKPEIVPAFEGEVEGINVTSLGGYYNELKHFLDTVENNQLITIAPLSEAIKSLELDLKEVELAGGMIKK